MSNYYKYAAYNREYNKNWLKKKKQDPIWYADWKEKQKKYWERNKSKYKKLRFQILARDNFTCQYCGRKAPYVVLHIDHIIPVSKGGQTKESNLRTACQDCNLGKSDCLLDKLIK